MLFQILILVLTYLKNKFSLVFYPNNQHVVFYRLINVSIERFSGLSVHKEFVKSAVFESEHIHLINLKSSSCP